MMQTMFGPWAVVTGASSGIGEAFARALAADGLHLVLVARRTDRLTALGAELSRTHDVEHRVLTVDLARPDGPATVVEATTGTDVGLLVSNAGAGHPGRFVEQDVDDLHRRLRLNAVSHLELSHAFGRRLAARGHGGMVLVSALGASAGIPNMAHEAGSKAYVDALGTALHHELAGAGVKVLVMRPGNVDTAAPNRSANQTITRAPLVLGGDGTVTVGVVAGVAGVRSSVVLREAAHHGRTYELTGPASSTPRRRAADLAAALGRTQHRRLPLRSAPGREPRTGGGGPARCDASQLAPSRTSCSRRAKASGWPG